REMRWMQARHPPLVARVVGDAQHPDLAVAPRLSPRPLNALIDVLDLAWAVAVHEAGRPAGAARVHADDDVAVRNPALGVGDFPVLVLVRRALEDLRVVFDHLAPLVRIAVLISEALGVHPVAQDHRVLALVDRREQIGTEDEAVVHRDRLVPGDLHAVPDLGARYDLGELGHRYLLGEPDARPRRDAY